MMQQKISFACLLLLLFTSCSKKVDIEFSPPKIGFNTPATAVSFVGGKVYFTLRAEANGGLFAMKQLRSVNGGNTMTDTTFQLSGTVFEWPITYVVPPVDSLPHTIRLFFEVTDLQGRTASSAFVISVDPDPIQVGVSRTGTVYHINAPNRNAQWDLVNNGARAFADSFQYDLVNITPASSATLQKGWRSPAASSYTEFARVSGVVYDSLKAKDIINLWNSPATVHVTQLSGLAVGDVVLLWLRNGAYGVLRITQIDDMAVSKDDQFIRFVYRKQE